MNWESSIHLNIRTWSQLDKSEAELSFLSSVKIMHIEASSNCRMRYVHWRPQACCARIVSIVLDFCRSTFWRDSDSSSTAGAEAPTTCSRRSLLRDMVVYTDSRLAIAENNSWRLTWHRSTHDPPTQARTSMLENPVSIYHLSAEIPLFYLMNDDDVII